MPHPSVVIPLVRAGAGPLRPSCWADSTRFGSTPLSICYDAFVLSRQSSSLPVKLRKYSPVNDAVIPEAFVVKFVVAKAYIPHA